ncbi:cytidylate kinase-like family protein [Bacteroides heparinolyticus]|uniref:cytidylate kinase-like family protein n=1 Tax=Prevotella heparinolytica TaxID=28113 RepID=UPI0028E9A4F9|nr:cytidylate kinase-like family protein [Bacteroides heparinolyticus]
MDNKFVVNVGRQFGSGGREVGEKLASRLGIGFYDKELINLASEESGFCCELFEKADEKTSQGVLGGLYGMRFPFISDGAIPVTSCLSNDALFKIQSDVIRKLASKGSCLFVGRCADYILRDHPRCVNIFVSSTPEDRIARICRKHPISEKEAEELMEKADKRRANYYNFYSNKTWGTASTYHLCIDSSVLGIDATADFLEEFVKRKLSGG